MTTVTTEVPNYVTEYLAADPENAWEYVPCYALPSVLAHDPFTFLMPRASGGVVELEAVASAVGTKGQKGAVVVYKGQETFLSDDQFGKVWGVLAHAQ